jgi:putative ABC transport system substrate-binding protein
LKITLISAPYDLSNPGPGLDEAARRGAQAVFFDPSSGTQRPENQRRLAHWMIERRIPGINGNTNAADNGCLMCLGSDIEEAYRRTAYFVDRLLRGAKPSELPAEQPSTAQLVVNLRTAAAMRLDIPPTLLLQADRVIR